MFRMQEDGALLTTPGLYLTLTVSGDAIYRPTAVELGEAIDMVEAALLWEESGGSEDEWDAAASYVDSLR